MAIIEVFSVKERDLKNRGQKVTGEERKIVELHVGAFLRKNLESINEINKAAMMSKDYSEKMVRKVKYLNG